MKIEEKINTELKGILTITTTDAQTGEVLGEETINNTIVLESREAVTVAISQPVANSTIDVLKIGEDFGEKAIGDPNITFFNGNPDTITRDAGSWVTDGFVAGDRVTVTGTVSNDGEYTIEAGGVTALVLTLIGTDVLLNEGPLMGIEVETGIITAPIAAKNTYDSTTMDLIYTSPETLGVGYPDTQSVNFSVTINGAAVMALFPMDTSKRINSAALHTGNDKAFSYIRFPRKSISALINLTISWVLTY